MGYEEEVMSVEFFGGIGRKKPAYRPEAVFGKKDRNFGSVDRNYGSAGGNSVIKGKFHSSSGVVGPGGKVVSSENFDHRKFSNSYAEKYQSKGDACDVNLGGSMRENNGNYQSEAREEPRLADRDRSRSPFGKEGRGLTLGHQLFTDLNEKFSLQEILEGKNGSVVEFFHKMEIFRYKASVQQLRDSKTDHVWYIGEICAKNLPNGIGIQFIDSSVIYEGNFVSGEFTGNGCCYNQKGIKICKGFFKNYILNGPAREYHANGVLKIEADFTNGLSNDNNAKIYNTDGSLVYYGAVQNGDLHGKGVLYYENGEIYDGEFENNVRSGCGCLIMANGEKINGLWSGDTLVSGWQNKVLIDQQTNQIIYEGDITNGLANGFGVQRLPDGSKYIGEFDNNIKKGIGKIVDPKGSVVFKGEFRENLFNGYGEIYYEYGNLKYKGYFEKGVFHGQGSLFNTKGKLVYKGLWDSDQKNGFGKEFYKNGARFEGEFVAGVKNGNGVYYYSSGLKYYEGEWRQG
jgi:hypothetical protein